MVYISGGRIVSAPPPPHAMLAALRRHPLILAALALTLALAASQYLELAAVAALAVPTLARSRAPGPSSDAAIARDAFFAHTYSRAKPRARAATWGAFFASWRARLRALAARDEGEQQAQQARAQGLPAQAREWAAFGEDLGAEWSAGRSGFTRCAQASFAVETFFCGSGAATALHGPGAGRFYEPGAAALGRTVHRALELGAALIVEVRLGDDEDRSFGHHFALRVAPGEGVKLYMSFIGEYTLGAYLARHPAPLGPQQWQAALQQLQALEAASGSWGGQAEAAYRALFDVHLGERRRPKKAAGVIGIAHAAVCVLPPWNGSAADPAAAGFAESVRQLLPRELQPFSLLGGAPASPAAEAGGGAAAEEPYF